MEVAILPSHDLDGSCDFLGCKRIERMMFDLLSRHMRGHLLEAFENHLGRLPARYESLNETAEKRRARFNAGKKEGREKRRNRILTLFHKNALRVTSEQAWYPAMLGLVVVDQTVWILLRSTAAIRNRLDRPG